MIGCAAIPGKYESEIMPNETAAVVRSSSLISMPIWETVNKNGSDVACNTDTATSCARGRSANTRATSSSHGAELTARATPSW